MPVSMWSARLSLRIRQRQEMRVGQPVVVQRLHGYCGGSLILELDEGNALVSVHANFLESAIAAKKADT